MSARRLARERKTMLAMLTLFCQDRHDNQGKRALCPDCQELLDYAMARLERCPFGDEKPTCAKCPIHCYQPRRRQQVIAVMRHAGPRLLWRHPLFTLRHWLRGRRRPMPAPKGARP